MDKIKIPLIMFAVFSILLLMTSDNMEFAYAVTFKNVTYTADSGGSETLVYAESVNRYVIFNPSDDILQTVHATSQAITSNPISAGTYVSEFDCSDSSDLCVFLETVGNDLRAKTTSGSAIWDNTDLGTRVLDAGDVVRIRGNSIYVPAVCSGVDTDRVIMQFSTGDGSLDSEIGDCAGVSIGAGVSVIDIEVNSNLLALTLTGAANTFQIWNLNTGLRVCADSSMTLALPEGSITRMSSTWYVNDGTTLTSFTDACAGATDITSANHGLTTTLTGNGISSGRGELYIQTASSVAVMNTTSPTERLYSIPCGDAGTIRYNFEAVAEHDQIACLAQTANSLHIRQLEASSFVIDQEVCIDTNLNGDADLCFSDTNNDGVADNGQSGALGAFNSNANITQMGTQWFCAFNVGGACDNPDVKTNGVGVFYTIMIIIFSYALLVGIHIMAQKQLGSQQVVVMNALTIHPILLLVMLFLDVGLAWYLDFIEDTIFYTALVIPVGLAGFGIYKQIRGGS